MLMKYDPTLREWIHFFINNVYTFRNRLFMSSVQRFDVINNQAIARVLGK